MLLIVRGDLQSETGWSRATRALVSAISRDFSAVLGVDLHYHPQRSRSDFPGMIVSDETYPRMLTGDGKAVVLHATLPDGIFRCANAINVGWWFWETDKLPSGGDWLERLGSLDHSFVPSPWQKALVDRLNLGVGVSVLPWPHTFDAGTQDKFEQAAIRERTGLYRVWQIKDFVASLEIDRSYHTEIGRVTRASELVAAKQALLAKQRVPFKAAMTGYDGYVFAIQSDAPRKGLPVMIREWCGYRNESHRNVALIIRFSSLDVGLDPASVMQKFTEISYAAAGGMSGLEHVYLILDHLDDHEVGSFYSGAEVFVAPTYGEGFGGTLVEAVQNDSPIISAGHTACAQLLPESYPGVLTSTPHIGSLMGQLSIQPANGSWHIPDPGQIARALLWAERLSAGQRAAEVDRLRSYMRDVLSRDGVRAAFLSVIDGLIAQRGTVRAIERSIAHV